MKKILFALIVAGLLSGCVSPMTKQDVANASYKELPSNYQETIKEIISDSLKDPESAKYKFHSPRLSYTASTKHVAYTVPVEVNAKNSYGGYTGYKTMYFAYFNNEYKDVTTGVKYTAVQWVDDISE